MIRSLHFPSVFAKFALSFLAASFLIFPQTIERPALAHGSDSIRIDIEKDGFEPASISIQPGATVEWRNKEHEPHSVAEQSAAFNSGIISKEGTYSFTFNTPGTYVYIDQYASFRGTITVLGASGAPPSATPPPAPSPTPNPNSVSPSVPSTLRIGDDFFTPASFSTTVGTTVTWTNSGQSTHSVTSNTGLFDSSMLRPGQSFSYTFQSPGIYSYQCIFHSGQNGTITVTGSGNPASNTATPPPTTPTTTPPATVTVPAGTGVQIGDNLYSPVSLSLGAGSTVTWINAGALPHTVTSDTGLFDSGMLKKGQSFSFSFLSPGVYPYHCLFHSGQNGAITVTGSGNAIANATTPPAPATATTSTPAVTQTATLAPTAAAAPAPAASNIRVGDNLYAPVQMSLPAGSTATWTNTGAFPHTVTSDTGLFDSGMLKPGQSFSFSFQTPGTYPYRCVYHQGQEGTLIVSDGGNPAPLVSPASSGESHDVHIAAGNQDKVKTLPADQTANYTIEPKGPPPPPPPTIFTLEPIAFLVVSALAFLMGGLAVLVVKRRLG
ncbi:MAG: cupredoxin domain-containing protein [Chloroflexi bacterium]|nr:cupredoxin domain-containing protein [Chloroflexota bacterium]